MPDASAAILLFTDQDTDHRVAAARRILDADTAWIVPEHWHTEMFSAIRGLWLGKKLSDADAERAARTLARMVVGTTPTAPLLPRMWELRGNLTGYDAAYVATAENRDCTLVTADARIAKAGVARCPIQVIT
ncbi:type II toxin-antitoxin system VapC family toxin [Myceligenerans pegani]|uniref:Ribonuclease VapC n=1 Tax=Myceligenerans pegani TaxID=2776917 RepID=A0ABR9MZ30_9MICO|nr:type II toxin-antitoxin system VapC family toxin [Myceligenerans sp. TRM 65318]MBE1876634.1 type II toxin-antitoxin system VapC family toxin [Myceligenerans sp. TRM 65318]MBE3018905.1 type II toxin-antitoxin system VapC family toxin [Myceligenerans sp. TRM 65318]